MTTERAATLEDVLSDGQPSEESVADDAETTVEPDDTKEEPENPSAEELNQTPDEKAEIGVLARIDAEVDKRINSHREKREADIALIRTLREENKTLKDTKIVSEGTKRLEAILSDDQDSGLSDDEVQSRQAALSEFNRQYREFKSKSVEVEETAQLIGDMAENLPKDIVKEFGLNDDNPNIRASNGVRFLDETVSVYKHNQDFLMAIEGFLPRGDELRKQIDEITSGMSEFTDGKSKKLYLKDRLQGVKVPRKKPPTSSDSSGGEVLVSDTPQDRLTKILANDNRRNH